MSTSEALETMLQPLVDQHQMVLEKIVVTKAGKRSLVRIVVDLPAEQTGALDLDDVASLSRDISEVLDEAPIMGNTPYVLEVTSPGVDRPLTERRHWLRARTRLVTATLHQGSPVTGRLMTVDDDGVLLHVHGNDQVLTWDQIHVGRMEIELNRSAAANEAVGAAQDDAVTANEEVEISHGH